jgi:DNA-directed RNA polymerase subunit K/omega
VTLAEHRSNKGQVYTFYGLSTRYTGFSAFLSAQPRPAHPQQSKKAPVIRRPAGSNRFEFAVVSGLRAAQLMRGCIPKVEREHKVISTAQLEVATGKIARVPAVPAVVEEV